MPGLTLPTRQEHHLINRILNRLVVANVDLLEDHRESVLLGKLGDGQPCRRVP
jgi:hypothetical protein